MKLNNCSNAQSLDYSFLSLLLSFTLPTLLFLTKDKLQKKDVSKQFRLTSKRYNYCYAKTVTPQLLMEFAKNLKSTGQEAVI
nr:hypothetical protein B11C_110257 [Bartonella sp. 1-1C]